MEAVLFYLLIASIVLFSILDFLAARNLRDSQELLDEIKAARERVAR